MDGFENDISMSIGLSLSDVDYLADLTKPEAKILDEVTCVQNTSDPDPCDLQNAHTLDQNDRLQISGSGQQDNSYTLDTNDTAVPVATMLHDTMTGTLENGTVTSATDALAQMKIQQPDNGLQLPEGFTIIGTSGETLVPVQLDPVTASQHNVHCPEGETLYILSLEVSDSPSSQGAEEVKKENPQQDDISDLLQHLQEPQRSSTPNVQVPDLQNLNETILAGNLENSECPSEARNTALQEIPIIKLMPTQMDKDKKNMEESIEKKNNVEVKSKNAEKNKKILSDEMDNKKKIEDKKTVKMSKILINKEDTDNIFNEDKKTHNETFCRDWVKSAQQLQNSSDKTPDFVHCPESEPGA